MKKNSQILQPSLARMANPSLCYVLLLLYIFSGNVSARIVAPASEGFDGTERDALLALKKAFDNPVLDRNWNGLQCYMNQPPKWIGIRCVNGRVTEISLEGLALSGTIDTDALFNLTELTLLSFKNNSISGNIVDFSMNRKLAHLDLSGNKFEGVIPQSLLSLDRLKSLDLRDNNLTGGIPAFNQQALSKFNVSNNNLSGEIPVTPILRSMDASSFLGNPDLCGPPLPKVCQNPISRVGNLENDSTPDTSKKKSNIFTGIPLLAVFAALGVIVLSLVILIIFRCLKREKPERRPKSESTIPERRAKTEVEDRRVVEEKRVVEEEKRRVVEEEKGRLSFIDGGGGFELSDLLRAFAEGLGKGSFGSCYKAVLENGPPMVVKRLKDLNPLSNEEFKRHMITISNLKHPNLVPLLAYYHAKDEKLLVYKFAENGNLFNRIHGGRDRNRLPFKWNARLSVAQGVARAMAFLHHNSKSRTHIPHGNLKSTNVLLTGDDEALVSDYGLAPLIAPPVAVQRMMCYRSPEYQQKQRLSPRSDVWSYGCLLLELLTGRIPSHSSPQGIDLSNWVHRAVREEWTAEIFDLEILAQRSAASGMLKLLQIAIRCCEKSPEMRPGMREVVKEVEKIQVRELEEYSSEYDFDSASISSNASRVFDEGTGYPGP